MPSKKYTEEELLQRLDSKSIRSHSLAVRKATTENVLLKAVGKGDGRLIYGILYNPHATEAVLLSLLQMDDWKYCRDIDFVDLVNHPNTTPKVLHAAVKAWVQQLEGKDPFVLAIEELFARNPLMCLQLAVQNEKDPLGFPFLR